MTRPDPVVDAAWMAEHRHDPRLVILDCRVALTPAGPIGDRDGYLAGHVPGAVYADLPGGLSDPTAGIRFALPEPSILAAALGRLGVGDDSRVVVYDSRVATPNGQMSCLWASRVWWMLRWLGVDDVAVLNGGIDAWIETGGPTASGHEERPPRQLTPRVRPQLLADLQEMRRVIGHPSVTVVDVLEPSHYSGQSAMYARRGHIAGAVNRPVSRLYDPEGYLLPPRSIPEPDAAGHQGSRVIAYCGAGIAAAAYALARTRAGVEVAVYAASLQEWASDPELPMDCPAVPITSATGNISRGIAPAGPRPTTGAVTSKASSEPSDTSPSSSTAGSSG